MGCFMFSNFLVKRACRLSFSKYKSNKFIDFDEAYFAVKNHYREKCIIRQGKLFNELKINKARVNKK